MSTNRNFTSLMLIGSGLLFLLAAALYQPKLLELLDPVPPVWKVVTRIEQTRLTFLQFGILCVLLGVLLARIPTFSRWTRQPLVMNFALTALTIALPLTFLEVGLKPFASREATTIFMRDEALGWRLRPNAIGTWGGVPVEINAKGLRGPELPYEKPDDDWRILYLGDSVTFGFLLADVAATFPYQVEHLLEQQGERDVETVNAGVGGYSPWQAYRYFADEGTKYNPDLVIVSFVLNDVTEKFELSRFGGRWEGYQVTHTAFSQLDLWASRSSTVYFLKQIGIALRNDQRQSALVQEKLDVEMLAYQPAHPDVERAWEITLANLAQIVDLAAEKDIPVALVIFPFTFQFDDVAGTSAPQQRLTTFAQSHDIPVLDLLPHLAAKTKAEHSQPADYFFDEDHLTARGSTVVAEMIVTFLLEMGLGPPAT